jgi:magnesium-transporting ATPase (P-type)
VKTTNLDGETNLKVKRCAPSLSTLCSPRDALEDHARFIVFAICRQVLDEDFYHDGWTENDVFDLDLELECEKPNSNLHNFRGRISIIKGGDKRKPKIVPISMSQMLLRGCLLKNSHYIFGLVVYTGAETRIQMNSAAAPLKIGSFDHFLNMQVAILIMGQTLLCILCAVLKYIWRESEVRCPATLSSSRH